MSYIEIMQALENGFKVYWINSAYKVFLDSGKLYEINIYTMVQCVACKNHNIKNVLLENNYDRFYCRKRGRCSIY